MAGEVPRLVDLCSTWRTSALALVVCALIVCASPLRAAAQVPLPDSPVPEAPRVPGAPRSAGVPIEPVLTPSEYRIGSDDVLSITVLQAPELNTSVRVAEAGDISLPLIGVLRASALTTRELEDAIKERLRAKFIRDPEVSVLVTEVRSHGVSVVGAVNRPGLIQVRGTSTLLEVLSLAGGLADTAGDSVVVVRQGPEGTTPIDIKLKALLSADISANIAMQPGDVVNVQNAALIYVMGAVNKPGAFAMRGNDRLTVLRALAYGEGTTAAAAKGDAFVLRLDGKGERIEIPLDLDAILKGRTPDVEMQAQDLLFVPQSGAKTAGKATLDYLTRIISLRNLLP
jgi:polysaccharide export outer membrane protein